ncbi:AAA family ATPase [Desulfobacter latus]|uniref:AAA family ATPase n=1 Tax=Desulfobacter latus TaxID=2292 RepID=A0A850SZ15_9BACT|nr:AAA family ATPase [Desulfobacter latus]NWH04673.1 AAA family ATPase [Desulfobacter latus]
MRYLSPYIIQDLGRKMAFLGGPRQVGKTTLAKMLLNQDDAPGRYFNWDFDEDRQDVLAQKWSDDANLIVFDELHKYPNWKVELHLKRLRLLFKAVF